MEVSGLNLKNTKKHITLKKRKDVVCSVSFPRILFDAIEELRGDVPRSVWIQKQLMKVIDIEVKV